MLRIKKNSSNFKELIDYSLLVFGYVIIDDFFCESDDLFRSLKSKHLKDLSLDKEAQNNNYLDTLNQAWVGLNRIELTEVDIQAENSVFKRIAKPIKAIKLQDLSEYSDFDFEPLYINHQVGIQTIDLRELGE